MKSTSGFLIIILALTTLAGAALAWREYEENAGLRATALALTKSDSELKTRLAQALRQNKDLANRLAAMGGRARGEGSAAAGTAPGSAAAADGQQPGPRRGNAAGFRAMLNNPQFQKLMGIQQKAMLDNTYAALFKSLNLSPQQLDQFKNLMVQRQQAAMDATEAAREQGINPRTDPQDFQQAIAQAQASVDTQIQSVLGDQAFTQYQQYQQTLPQRSTANQLQQSLSYTSTPLSDDQAAQLIQILAQTAPAAGGNPGFGMGNPMGGGGGFGGGGVQITDQAITQAQSMLSAPQLQALQQLQQQQQARQQMQQLMRASRQGAGG